MTVSTSDELPEREPGPPEQPWLLDPATLGADLVRVHEYFCRRGLEAEADLLTQETFLRLLVWQKAHPGQEPPPNLRVFLYCNARFVLKQYFRELAKARSRTRTMVGCADFAALEDSRLLASSSWLSEEVVGSACAAALQTAIAELSDHQRDTLLAWFIDDLPASHIAELFEVTERAVRLMIKRTLDVLRESPHLKPYGPRGGGQ